MHIVKFPWVKHTEGTRKFEIYSISVSPDGLRLATGGLDGKIKIWSIETFYKYKNESTSAINNKECRPLCSMSRHEGAITCVRFSPNNRFLATGSDDKLVLIWEKDEEKTRIMNIHRNNNNLEDEFGGLDDDSDLEHWTVRKRLVAHDNDVQDMAWSPDGSILVTVGLDRSIVVWNGNTFEKIKKFDIHQSHVKGVIFDPAGKYFATSSDDRSMRIFRYRHGLNVDGNGNDIEFVIEQVIKEPFAKSPLTTYFRRSSWSPDGLYIAAPNGINQGINANIIIKRGNWENELSLIGHRLPCEVCSFSPRLYDPQNNKPSTETVLITAGQDKTLALWSSNCATPLCVATEISTKSITDVAWNPNGLNVYLCGLDGEILSLFFDERELGKVLSIDENNRSLVRYGKDRDLYFPESVEQLKLEQYAEKKFGVNGNINKIQKIDRIKSLMNNDGNNSDLNLDKSHHSTAAMNVLVPRSKRHPHRKMPVPAITKENTTFQQSSSSKVNVLSSQDQKITITKNGKKRVAPTLISVSSQSGSTRESPKFESSSISSSLNTKTLLNLQKRSRLSKIISLPYPPLPKHGLPTLVFSAKSNFTNAITEIENSSSIDYIAESNQTNNKNLNGKSISSTSNKSKFSNSNKRQNGNSRGGISSVNDANNGFNKRKKLNIPDWVQDSIVNPVTMYGEKNTNSNIIVQKSNSKEQILEIRYEFKNNYKYINNNCELDDSDWNEFDSLTRLIAKSTTNSSSPYKSKNEWELFLNEKIVFVDDSQLNGLQYWCLCTSNGRILIITSTGRQLCGSIELGSDIVNLICYKGHILCICSNTLVYSWKFENLNNGIFQGKSIIEGVSLAPIINIYSTFIANDDTGSTSTNKKKFELNSLIDSMYMLENGCPIIVVKSNKRKGVYTFDLNLDSWIEVLDNWYLEKLSMNNTNNENSLKLISSDNKIIKLIIRRLISEVNNNKNDSKPLDKIVIDNISKNWHSIYDCIEQSMKKIMEKC